MSLQNSFMQNLVHPTTLPFSLPVTKCRHSDQITTICRNFQHDTVRNPEDVWSPEVNWVQTLDTRKLVRSITNISCPGLGPHLRSRRDLATCASCSSKFGRVFLQGSRGLVKAKVWACSILNEMVTVVGAPQNQ